MVFGQVYRSAELSPPEVSSAKSLIVLSPKVFRSNNPCLTCGSVNQSVLRYKGLFV